MLQRRVEAFGGLGGNSDDDADGISGWMLSMCSLGKTRYAPMSKRASKAQRAGYYNPPSANPAPLTGPKADMATLQCPASPLTAQAVDENPRPLIKKHGPYQSPYERPYTQKCGRVGWS